jgi:hypothetical protein
MDAPEAKVRVPTLALGVIIFELMLVVGIIDPVPDIVISPLGQV